MRLRERLLELASIIENENGRGHEIAPILLREAAVTLDAKDAEIKKLRDALKELTEPISDAGHTTADGLRHEIEALREALTTMNAGKPIATGWRKERNSER